MAIVSPALRLTARVLRRLAQKIDAINSDVLPAVDQWHNCGFGELDIDAVALAHVAAGGEASFVQIGAHDGVSDGVMRACVDVGGMRGLFVEPQPGPFATLAQAYANNPLISCEKTVVGSADGTARLYSVEPQFWARHRLPAGVASQISSLFRDHIRAHVARFGGEALAQREADYLRWEDVPSCTLPTLLARHNLHAPGLMVIDTEGFDFEIIKMINWTRPPAILCYESIHLSADDRQASWDLLRAQGYSLHTVGDINTLAVRIPDKRG